MPELLTDEELNKIASRIAAPSDAVEGGGVELADEHGRPADSPAQRYRYVRPLTEAADNFIEFVQNPEGRFMLGLHDVDAMIRGFGRGELTYVTGRAHSGKTQVLVNAIVNNPDKRVILFTPDEVAELVLAKLLAVKHSIPGDEIERRIKARDHETIELVRRAAREDFANLIVIDQSLRMDQMADAVEEARDFYGTDIDLVVIDFLELLPGSLDGAEGVVSKSQRLKRWTKDANVPVICLHQASRSSGERGQSAGMNAMRYGGETEAIFVLEVYRKREDRSLDEWEQRRHQNTVTVAVHKNKRPPCKTGSADFFMDPATGLIRPLEETDFGMFSPAAPSLGELMRDW